MDWRGRRVFGSDLGGGKGASFGDAVRDGAVGFVGETRPGVGFVGEARELIIVVV